VQLDRRDPNDECYGENEEHPISRNGSVRTPECSEPWRRLHASLSSNQRLICDLQITPSKIPYPHRALAVVPLSLSLSLSRSRSLSLSRKIALGLRSPGMEMHRAGTLRSRSPVRRSFALPLRCDSCTYAVPPRFQTGKHFAGLGLDCANRGLRA
jgi:hypothetical protein